MVHKKIKGRPEELDMDQYFGRVGSTGSGYNQFNGTYPRGLKVPDRPEIVFPKSLYDPLPGVRILGLQGEGQTQGNSGNGGSGNGGVQTQPGTGAIKIDTIPMDAEVFIVDSSGNEVSFGTTDPSITITDVDIGSYNYIIKKEGYTDYTNSIDVREGEICCITVNLVENTKSQQCVVKPAAYEPEEEVPTYPPSQHGYTVVKDTNLMMIIGAIALIGGLIIGYYILKKKD